MVMIVVRNNNVDSALKELRKDLQKEKVFSILKIKRNYEKPSDKRTRKRKESRRKKRTYVIL